MRRSYGPAVHVTANVSTNVTTAASAFTALSLALRYAVRSASDENGPFTLAVVRGSPSSGHVMFAGKLAALPGMSWLISCSFD
jgi:hypothetical protein